MRDVFLWQHLMKTDIRMRRKTPHGEKRTDHILEELMAPQRPVLSHFQRLASLLPGFQGEMPDNLPSPITREQEPGKSSYNDEEERVQNQSTLSLTEKLQNLYKWYVIKFVNRKQKQTTYPLSVGNLYKVHRKFLVNLLLTEERTGTSEVLWWALARNKLTLTYTFIQ